MATQPMTPHPSGPTTTEAFIADRLMFWGRFTRFVVYAAAVVAIVLIGMAIFLT